MLVFEGRGKAEYPEKNLSEQKREPTNSGMASTLTTAPSLLPIPAMN